MYQKIYLENSRNSKVKFIGDYCLEDPKSLTEDSLKNFKKKLISEYHWNNYKKMKNDYKFLSGFIKKKNKELVQKFKKYHSSNLSEKSFKIILFPWLVTISYILFDRWEMVNTIKNKKKYIFNSYKFEKDKLIPDTFRDVKFLNKEFNLMILSLILDFDKNKVIKKTLKIVEHPKYSIKKTIFEKILSKVFYIFSLLFKNKIILSNVGVTFIDNIKVNLFLKQFPFILFEPNYKKKKINIVKRKKFFFKKRKKKNFEGFFDQMIYLLIPKSYLEDFSSINDSLNESYWPKHCNKILTAYDYKVNDVFKIWCANMVKQKAKYLILQHGGNFGSSEYEIEEDIQKGVADTFLSWGWKDKIYKNVKPFCAFNFNFIKKENRFKNKNLLICVHFNSKYSYRISSLPKTNFDRINRLFRIKKLIKNLNSKNPITLRYQKSLEKNFEVKFNKNFFPSYINYDTAKQHIRKIIHRYNLIIHDADSTTFLESMFLNFPSILLLDKNIDRFRSKADKLYKDLESKNIIFYDPVKAAKFIKKIESSVDKWWYNQDLQKVRKDFCNNFAKHSKNPIKDLKKFLI